MSRTGRASILNATSYPVPSDSAGRTPAFCCIMRGQRMSVDNNIQLEGRQARLDAVRRCVAERLFRDIGEVTPGSRLITDLGADSLDFVDLLFQLEKRF